MICPLCGDDPVERMLLLGEQEALRPAFGLNRPDRRVIAQGRLNAVMAQNRLHRRMAVRGIIKHQLAEKSSDDMGRHVQAGVICAKVFEALQRQRRGQAVSYTHLTLPTTRIV